MPVFSVPLEYKELEWEPDTMAVDAMAVDAMAVDAMAAISQKVDTIAAVSYHIINTYLYVHNIYWYSAMLSAH